jgi:prevent-host-death family protein
MRSIGTRELQAKIRESIEEAQAGPVVVTQHGKPAALIVGVAGCDLLDVARIAEALTPLRKKGK